MTNTKEAVWELRSFYIRCVQCTLVSYSGWEWPLCEQPFTKPNVVFSFSFWSIFIADFPTIACKICGDRSSGVHYGIISCEGCKVIRGPDTSIGGITWLLTWHFWGFGPTLNPLRTVLNYGHWPVCRYFCPATNWVERRVEPITCISLRELHVPFEKIRN